MIRQHRRRVAKMLDRVSVVIPVSPEERAHKKMLQHFEGTDAEVIVSCEGSRARSLNMGAAQSSRDFLWFLHADSRLDDSVFAAVDRAVQAYRSPALFYFNLGFYDSGLARVNAWGANVRSCIFAAPYGDQGFFMARDTFEKIGGFDDNLEMAEDLHFVLTARQKGIDIKPIGATILTSARRYKKVGWLRLTARYQMIFCSIYFKDMLERLRGKA